MTPADLSCRISRPNHPADEVVAAVNQLHVTYYKIRLSVEPNYTVPKCRCTGRESDKTEVVLRSRESAILGIPNSILATLLYRDQRGLGVSMVT